MSASYRAPNPHDSEVMYSPKRNKQIRAVPDDGRSSRSAIEWDGPSLIAYAIWAGGRLVFPFVPDAAQAHGLARAASREACAPAYMEPYTYDPISGRCEWIGTREWVDASGYVVVR